MFSLLIFISSISIFANLSAQNAVRILQKTDSVINAPIDVKATSVMTIFSKSGEEQSHRTMQVFQKGAEKRLVRFLSPADQKGIAFLSLPDNNQILYLPAFGKTRRIASHIKNTRFAGTDYTYEDLEAKRYADDWHAILKEDTREEYVLSLTPKKGCKTNYSRMDIRILKSSYFPIEIIFYNKKGVKSKCMKVLEVGNHKGFVIAKISEMKDLVGGTSTRTQLQEIDINIGIPDELFTERNLLK